MNNLNDKIEYYAKIMGCKRHDPTFRACKYKEGSPCQCRKYTEFLDSIHKKARDAAIKAGAKLHPKFSNINKN